MTAFPPPERPQRLFIALPLPPSVVRALQRAQLELRAAAGQPPGVTWTAPRNLHLTLRFLGRVGPERVAGLVDALRRAVAGQPALELRGAGFGAFPDLHHPRIIWAGVEASRDGLAALADALNSSVAPFAESPAEATFTAHITLARIKRPGRAVADAFARLMAKMSSPQFGAWRADAVELVRSELLPGGSRYTTLVRCPLGCVSHERTA